MTETTYIVCTYGGPILTDIRFRHEWKHEQDIILHRHLPRFQQGGVQGLVIPVTGCDEVALLVAEISRSKGSLQLATSPDQVREIIRKGACAVILGVSFEAIGAKLEYLFLYWQLGMAMFHLALNPRNIYVDGVGEHEPSGLSALGARLVQRLTELGVLVDVSHTSDAGIWDVLELINGPIVASHSNARAVCDNKRNLPDELAQAIVNQGGLIALSTYPTLVSVGERPSLDDYLDHIDYLADLVGPSALGVGADFIDYVYEMVMPKVRSTDPAGELYGEKEFATAGLASIEDIGRIQDGLARRGYDETTISGIMGENFLRVWGQAQERSETY